MVVIRLNCVSWKAAETVSYEGNYSYFFGNAKSIKQINLTFRQRRLYTLCSTFTTGLSVEESADEWTQTQRVALEDEQQKVEEDDGVDFNDLRLRCSHWLRETV